MAKEALLMGIATTADARPSPDRTTLVLVVGVAGVGKDRFCRALLKRVALTYIDKDTLTERLSPDSRSGYEYEAIRDRIYDTMWDLVETNLSVGNSVLVDAPHVKQLQQDSWRSKLKTLSNRTNATVRIVRLVCSRDELRRRLQERGLRRDDEKLSDFPGFLKREPIWFPIVLDHIDIDTEQDLETNAETAVQYVCDRRSSFNKDLFDSLHELWTGAIGRFDQRRPYEWRLILAVWGAIVALIIAILSGKAAMHEWAAWCLCGVGFGFSAVLSNWICNLKLRNDSDRDVADGYWDELRRMVPVAVIGEQENNLRKARARRGRPFWTDWNHRSQILITWLLWLSMVFVVLGVQGQMTEDNGNQAGHGKQGNPPAGVSGSEETPTPPPVPPAQERGESIGAGQDSHRAEDRGRTIPP